MKKINLTRNQIAFVDDDDFELVSGFKWQALWSESTQSFYAFRAFHSSHGVAREGMHNLITGEKQVDHINGNTLDNQRHNLRPADHSQNGANRKIGKNNSSGYKGVSPDRRSGRWQAGIKHHGKSKFLGYFDDPIEAAKAYDSAASTLFGEYARLNFPENHDSPQPSAAPKEEPQDML